jgi:hypothetical protein
LWIAVHHEAIQFHVDRIIGQLREGITKAVTDELANFKANQSQQGSVATTGKMPNGVSLSDQERLKAADPSTALLLGKIIARPERTHANRVRSAAK